MGGLRYWSAVVHLSQKFSNGEASEVADIIIYVCIEKPVHRNHISRACPGLFAVMDDYHVFFTHCEEQETQNAFYDDHRTNVEVISLQVLNLFGEEIHVTIKFPGSWHEAGAPPQSDLSYPRISYTYMHMPTGFWTLFGSGYTVGTRSTNPKLIHGRELTGSHKS